MKRYETETINYNEMAEVELSYKPGIKLSKTRQVTSAQDAADILKGFWDTGKLQFVEQFCALLINRDNRVLGFYKSTCGGITGTVADPRLIFVAALRYNATRIILSHNHPAGSLRASEADKKLTEKMKKAGSFLEINVLDHIIITDEGYFSFAEAGLL